MRKRLGIGVLTIACLLFVMNKSSHQELASQPNRNISSMTHNIEKKSSVIEIKKELTKQVLEKSTIHKKDGHDHKECNNKINLAVDEFLKGHQTDDWDERHVDQYAQIKEQALEDFETTITTVDGDTVSKEEYLADIDKAARNSEFVSEGEASFVKYDANEEDLIITH